MSSEWTMEYFRSRGLLPFQAEFARDFCAPESPPYWELVAPVGTGKTFLASMLVACEIESGARRILVLAPRVLLAQWEHEVRSVSSIPPLLVDRRTYLELEANAPSGGNPWPDQALILMSIDLAKRNDMASSLSSADWDLIVIDESHLLTGQRRNRIERLKDEGHTKRALLLTATPGEPLEDITRRVLSREELTDWDGKPLFKVIRRQLLTLEYERTAEERQFLQAVEQFANELQRRTAVGRLQGALLLRAASSSVFAVETMLRRLSEIWRPIRNRIAHGMNVTLDDLKESQRLLDSAVDEVGLPELPEEAPIQPQDVVVLYDNLEQLLDRIDEVSSDAKLNILSSHLTERWRDGRKKFLCVWTSFVSTAQHLASSLEDLGIPLFSLTGAVDPETRRRTVEEVREIGGILIMTDVSAEGITLEYVDECVNYDLPESPDKFEQRWSRFLRISRTTDFEMVVLRDRSKSPAWDELVFRLLERASWERVALPPHLDR